MLCVASDYTSRHSRQVSLICSSSLRLPQTLSVEARFFSGPFLTRAFFDASAHVHQLPHNGWQYFKANCAPDREAIGQP